jgi:hypothetical protein
MLAVPQDGPPSHELRAALAPSRKRSVSAANHVCQMASANAATPDQANVWCHRNKRPRAHSQAADCDTTPRSRPIAERAVGAGLADFDGYLLRRLALALSSVVDYVALACTSRYMHETLLGPPTARAACGTAFAAMRHTSAKPQTPPNTLPPIMRDFFAIPVDTLPLWHPARAGDPTFAASLLRDSLRAERTLGVLRSVVVLAQATGSRVALAACEAALDQDNGNGTDCELRDSDRFVDVALCAPPRYTAALYAAWCDVARWATRLSAVHSAGDTMRGPPSAGARSATRNSARPLYATHGDLRHVWWRDTATPDLLEQHLRILAAHGAFYRDPRCVERVLSGFEQHLAQACLDHTQGSRIGPADSQQHRACLGLDRAPCVLGVCAAAQRRRSAPAGMDRRPCPARLGTHPTRTTMLAERDSARPIHYACPARPAETTPNDISSSSSGGGRSSNSGSQCTGAKHDGACTSDSDDDDDDEAESERNHPGATLSMFAPLADLVSDSLADLLCRSLGASPPEALLDSDCAHFRSRVGRAAERNVASNLRAYATAAALQLGRRSGPVEPASLLPPPSRAIPVLVEAMVDSACVCPGLAYELGPYAKAPGFEMARAVAYAVACVGGRLAAPACGAGGHPTMPPDAVSLCRAVLGLCRFVASRGAWGRLTQAQNAATVWDHVPEDDARCMAEHVMRHYTMCYKWRLDGARLSKEHIIETLWPAVCEARNTAPDSQTIDVLCQEIYKRLST